jgi:hypothetical protein
MSFITFLGYYKSRVKFACAKAISINISIFAWDRKKLSDSKCKLWVEAEIEVSFVP